MKVSLFHSDNAEFLGLAQLRSKARTEVRASTLVRRAAAGDRESAVALLQGFWPFVKEFEIAIDHHHLPRSPLREKFGQIANEKFMGLAEAVRAMKHEEGSHAAHWREDAACLGLTNLDGTIVPGVKDLIASAYSLDQVDFFSVLAGTELVAEELSAYLVGAEKFRNLFSSKRWTWGEVHLAAHEGGTSHLEIDLDLARAYSASEQPEPIGQLVIRAIGLFVSAAREVEAALLPPVGQLD